MSDPQIPPKKGAILIVDDTLDNLRLLSRMLTSRGHKVRAVSSGVRALEAVRANPPDLILLDIMMPEMNGYEVCQHLKANELSRDIPIIFISALNSAKDKVQALTAGGVDYITKPFQAEEVLARVETHLVLQSLQKNLRQEVAELDAFSHTVAHDLKNPLSLVMGYAEVLAEDYASISRDDLYHYAQAISRSSRKMQSIIEELMLLAGLRKAEVSIAPLDMVNIVAEAQTRLIDMIEKHQAEIILPETWSIALGYGPWIEEVWINYISNAIKYGGRPPRVELGADFVPSEIEEAEDGMIRFWVRDNGPGLTSEEQARLFVPFERLDQVRVEGHGLGLSIVFRIVERLGGQVGVESEIGQGSTFFFSLSMAQDQGA